MDLSTRPHSQRNTMLPNRVSSYVNRGSFPVLPVFSVTFCVPCRGRIHASTATGIVVIAPFVRPVRPLLDFCLRLEWAKQRCRCQNLERVLLLSRVMSRVGSRRRFVGLASCSCVLTREPRVIERQTWNGRHAPIPRHPISIASMALCPLFGNLVGGASTQQVSRPGVQ